MASVLLLLAACGSKNAAKEDGPVQEDTSPPTDSPIDPPVLAPCATPVNGTTVTTRRIGGNNVTIGQAALLVTAPAGDPRLFVVGRSGAIRIFENETLLPTPFIDLDDDEGGPVVGGDELGLLGLAFHPSYHANKTFFVYYTQSTPADATYELRNVVARCTASATDPNTANPTCVEVLAIKDTFANHNGGMIEFGKDGFLYIGTGDGGSSGDPDGNAQSLADGTPVARSIALLGKMLRIDVDNPSGGKEYGIPADNPFVAGGGPPEVFALGLRNPWRWSFDSLTGDIWIGDVGQGPNPLGVEEINFVKAGELKGKNFGWDMFHGNNCFTAPCDATGKTPPTEERSGGNPDNYHSITGGQVYRGTCYPDLAGTYFYTDFVAGGLASAKVDGAGAYSKQDLPGTFPSQVTSIHADARGELFMTTIGGAIHRIEAGP